MKKILCILMSLVLAFALFAPISATAAEIPADGQVMPLAGCSHTYEATYSYRYEWLSATYHEVYTIETKRCTKCGHNSVDQNYDFDVDNHSCTYTFECSVHEGAPSDHYLLYSGTCISCRGRAERKTPTPCTNIYCVDPY